MKLGRNKEINIFMLITFFLLVWMTNSNAERSYRLTDIGVGRAYDVNNLVQVVGSTPCPEAGNCPFLWTEEIGMENLGHLGEGWGSGYARGINDNGEVVGFFYRLNGQTPPYETAFYWSKDLGLQDLGQPNGFNGSIAQKINNNGEILIWAIQSVSSDSSHVFILDGNDIWHDLGVGTPQDSINSYGKAVGYYNGNVYTYSIFDGRKYIGNMGGPTIPKSINDLDVIVGHGCTTSDQLERHIFRWTPESGMEDLGDLGDTVSAINNNGEIIGWGKGGAFYWSDETVIIYLSDLLPENSGWSLDIATDINDLGQIVGVGTFDGVDHAFILKPYLIVKIDIMPQSPENSININDHGLIPVAILGSFNFDVTKVNPVTCSLQGMIIKIVGKSEKALWNYTDVNYDGFIDLLIKNEDSDGNFIEGQTEAALSGFLYDGTPIKGTDIISIVPGAF
jgi:hypothetical protein